MSIAIANLRGLVGQAVFRRIYIIPYYATFQKKQAEERRIETCVSSTAAGTVVLIVTALGGLKLLQVFGIL